MPDLSTKPAGRPSKLTPELHKKIEKLLKAGNFTTTVCGLVGIGASTFYEWKQQGEKDKEAGLSTPFSGFLDMVLKAEANAEEKCVRVVLDAAKGGRKVVKTTTKRQELVRRAVDPDWGPGRDEYPEEVRADDVLLREETTTTTEETLPNVSAAQWYLERKHPERWGRRRLELTGADGGPVRTQAGPTPEQLRKLSDAQLDHLEELLAALEEGAEGEASDSGTS